MNKNYLPWIVGILMLVSVGSVSSFSYCYQESANTTNQSGMDTNNCGLLYNGTYKNSSGFTATPAFVVSKFWDGNWSTQTSLSGIGSGYVWVNYTKPVGAVNATSQLKFKSLNYANTVIHCWNGSDFVCLNSPCMGGGDSIDYIRNYSIPNICFSQPSVQMRFTATLDGFGFYSSLYEDALYWGMGGFTTNVLNYNGIQIYYNVTIKGPTNGNYTDLYGSIELPIGNGSYNISIQSGNYTSNITNYNISGGTSQIYYLPNTQLNIYNAFTNQLITQNVTIRDKTTGINHNTTSGIFLYNPTNGIANLTINSTGQINYTSTNITQTVDPTQPNTINVYLIPIVYYNFIDESTLLPFNMSSPDGGLKVQVIYQDGNTTEYLLTNATNATGWYFNATQPVIKIRFLELYNTPSVLTITRTLLGESLDSQTVNVYLLNLRTTDVVVYTLQTFDLMSQYVNPRIIVSKIINGVKQTITGDYADTTGKFVVYLINGNQYTLDVLSDNQQPRPMGNFYSDSTTAGLVYLRLFEIVGVPLTQSQMIPISYATYLINLSGVPTIYTQYNNSVDNLINFASWYVYNGTDDTGTLLVTTNALIQQNGLFAWPVNTTGTTNYFVKLILNLDCINANYYNVTQCQTPLEYTKLLQLKTTIDLPGQFDDPFTLKWIIMILLLIVALSLNYRNASVGSLLLVGLAGFLAAINWFTPGPSENGVYIVLGLAAIVALVEMFNKGSQR